MKDERNNGTLAGVSSKGLTKVNCVLHASAFLFIPHPSSFFSYSAVFHLDNAICEAGGKLAIVRNHQDR
jgi:hypothetical protein